MNNPNNLEECFTELISIIDKEELDIFKIAAEDEIVGKSHFGLGLWMRNNWGLWAGSHLAQYFNNMGIFHPDDMSGIILTSFHRHLNGQDIRLDEQIKFYQEYWEKQS
jgi:hypothetical protein